MQLQRYCQHYEMAILAQYMDQDCSHSLLVGKSFVMNLVKRSLTNHCLYTGQKVIFIQ